jgi:hypothetical protein
MSSLASARMASASVESTVFLQPRLRHKAKVWIGDGQDPSGGGGARGSRTFLLIVVREYGRSGDPAAYKQSPSGTFNRGPVLGHGRVSDACIL